MESVLSKEDAQQLVPEKFEKLTVEVEKMECDNEQADAIADSECKTPTGEEYRIPPALTCPPAPRKRKASFYDDIKQCKKTVDKKVIEAIFSSLKIRPRHLPTGEGSDL